VRLNSLTLSNFRQHADTRIDFETGLTGIIGPNGSGKSTILEAIAWAIYGNAAARGTRDTIRYNRAGPRTSVRVELDFDLGGHRYRVVRGLTNAELYLDGAGAPIANSISGVSELLTRRLGMTREEFFNTYFTGQKELSVMAAMAPQERAQFLSHVLGYERLRAAQRLVRERKNAIAAEVAGLRIGMPDPDAVMRAVTEAESRADGARQRAVAARTVHDAAAARLTQVRPRWDAIQRERDALQNLLAELRVAEQEESGLARDIERVERELAELAASRHEREELARQLEPLGALSTEFQSLEVLAREEGRRQTLRETRLSVTEELTRLQERRSRIETAPRLEEEATVQLEERRAALEDLVGQLELRRTEWVRDRQEAETKQQALREQGAELRAQRDRLAAAGESGVCPTCTRPLGDTLRSVLELLDGQIEVANVDEKYYGARVEQLMEMPDDVKELDERRRAAQNEVDRTYRRLTKVQAAVHELAQLVADLATKEQLEAALTRELEAISAGYDAARHVHVRKEMARLQALSEQATRLAARAEREPLLTEERRQALTARAALDQRLGELRRQRDLALSTEADFAALRDEHEAAVAQLRAGELATVTAESEVSAAEAALTLARTAERELAKRRQTLSELNGRRRLHEELDRAFTDLRTDLNFQLRPELSELASAFLAELTDGRYAELELDDQYNLIVLEDGIAKPVISGGEEDMANLVLRLAISQMIAERAGQPFSLLILDEIFGSLDEMRRASVLELLRRLHDRFEQVILITHIESVREGMDQVISVRYDEEHGASRVERLMPTGGNRSLADDGEDGRLMQTVAAAD